MVCIFAENDFSTATVLRDNSKDASISFENYTKTEV